MSAIAGSVGSLLRCLRRLCVVCTAGLVCSAGAYAADLPVQCAPCGAQQFVGSGAANYAINGAIGTVTQQSDRAILNWQSFDIAAGNKIIFNQPTANSAALNRIFQNDPSRILGALQANGHVYLINQNGFLFGAGAQVNTHALTASTLDITDQIFNQLGPEQAMQLGLPAFEHDPAKGAMGSIEIAAGASLATNEGGRILLLAPDVVNRGTISTPGGEALLAASQDKVYLTTGYSPTGTLAQQTSRSITDVRGIVVEVGTGGSVTNLGKIFAERGSIGLVGLAVNQSGLVRATTSVNQGGAIWLVARDQAAVQDGSVASGSSQAAKRAPVATHTGTLVLGAGSSTEIGLDSASSKALDAQPQPQSRIELMGKTVTLQSGAQVTAPGGDVLVTATNSPGNPAVANLPANDTAFTMESGSRIDVAGARSAVLPMSRNLLAVELRGSQLADSPLQRDGPLRNKVIVIDVRKGTPFANVAANVATIERPIDERLAMGGTVSVVSEGSITIPKGSTVDFSGGAVSYLSGQLATTKLVRYDGAIVDIGDADPNVQYLGIYGAGSVAHPKWGVTESFGPGGGQVSPEVAGYVEGKDAGALQLQGRVLNLGGTLRGDVTVDRYQRNPASGVTATLNRAYDQIPLRGALTLGDSRGAAGDFGLQDFALQSLDSLDWQGIGRLSVYALGTISLAADQQLRLAGGSQLNLVAGNIDLQGTIITPGGAVAASARNTRSTAPGDSLLQLGSAASIDTSGGWVNDRLETANGRDATDPIFITGGAVNLQSNGNLTLAAGSVIDTSGGARLGPTGALTGGKGGSIALGVNYREPRTLTLNGTLLSDSLTQGGTLSLTAPTFAIASATGNKLPVNIGDAILLEPAFFANRGFSGYTLSASHGGIEVGAGTELDLRATNLVLDPQVYNYRPSGASLRDFATQALLPDYQRGAVSLSLVNRRAEGVASTESGILLATGSRISSDPGAAILVESDARLLVNGTIDAPAGSITLRQIPPASASNELGYDPSQALWLGPQAQLLARAVFRAAPSATTDLRSGQLLAGGSVTLSASRSYVFTDAKSVIDVSGRTEEFAVRQGQVARLTPVNADAGSISIQASEGGILAGELLGAPGSGAGARGGSLSLTLGGGSRAPDFNSEGDAPFPDQPHELRLTSSAGLLPRAGSPVPAELNGVLQVSPERLNGGGFAVLSLTSFSTLNNPDNGRIFFDGNTSLAPGRELVLTAPVLASNGGAVDLRSAHIVLGSADAGTAAPSDGTGVLTAHAGLLDLVGNVSLQGFGGSASTLISDGDLRLTGRATAPPGTRGGDLARITGQFRSSADLLLSAQQLYPTTLSDYRISVERSDGTLGISGGAPGAATPLSAGGLLELDANTVKVSGTVRAPFGQIIINANNADIEAGGLLSTSGAGVVVPFGNTEFGGADWIYRLSVNSGQSILAAPGKRVAINADKLTLAAGSVVDVTGGGDLLASEFVPGPGGTRDILASATAGGAFAVVPTLGSAFASYDPSLRADVLTAGRTIVLDGANGLPAGEYAVLPAAYALLPGAFLLTPRAVNALSPGATSLLPNGTQLATGRYGSAGSSERDSLATTFVVETGQQVLARAEYRVSQADKFFATTPAALLNRDAGQLVLNAGSALSLGGKLARNGSTGRGSLVDIVADQLSVVSTKRADPGAVVEVLDTDLNALGADSLSLGAVRKRGKTGTTLDVQALNVRVNSGSHLTVPETLLAARETVSISGGAQITASGTVKADTALILTGDSGLLRVSAGDQVAVTRTASAGQLGVVDVQLGAVLDSARSITLDASFGARVDGELATHGGSLGITVPQLAIGTPLQPSGGLLLSESRLAALDARELILGSRSSIDIYGALNSNLKNVVLDAAGLNGFENEGQAVALHADHITLRNSLGGAPATTGTGSGALQLDAREIDLERGTFGIAGFSAVTLSATDQFIGGRSGLDAALTTAGNLDVVTSRIVSGAGANVALAAVDAAGQAVGAVRLSAPAQSATNLAAVTALGGRLDVLGTSILLGTRIDLPSGDVRLRATGPDGISLSSPARISVAGVDTRFGDAVLGSVGGRIDLRADQGAITLAGGSMLDASGAASGANAGRVELHASGALDLASGAVIAARSAAGFRGGTAIISAANLARGFAALNTQLATSGISDRIDVHTGSGDLLLAAGESIVARDVALTADAGRIDILGRIDARSAAGGQVVLNARDDVLLGAGAVIDASATAAGGRGGRVSLGTVQGALSLASGSAVKVAGLDAQSAVTDGGVVSLRAPRIGADALGVASMASTISGAGRIQLEAFRTYQADTLDAVSYGVIAADSAAYMVNAPTLLANLGLAADSRVHLVAGEEIDSAGDLSLNGPLDLLGVRPGGDAGVLTLRAAGNLLVNGTLSDGVAFVSASPGDLPERDTVQVGPSWSYRLAAGANLTSANTLATAGGAGDVLIASGAVIRTGSGGIEVAAARDIRLADSTAALYTVGQNRGPGDIPVGSLPVSAQFVQELIYHGDFLEKGGDLSLHAARDIVGADGGQFISDWMARAGGAQNGALSDISVGNSWAIDVGKFRQNVGALGGGNVSIEAGGNIDNLSVMLPTTGQPNGPLGSAPAVAGGGDLSFYAGGDLRGGIAYVERGKALFDVGGGVSAAAGSNSLPILGAGATQISLQARRSVAIEAIVNPSALSQSATQGFSEFVNPKEDYFFTYTPDSSANITATSGDVTLRRNDTELNARSTGALNQNQVLGYQVLPASLSVHALQGSVGIGNNFTLYPAARGNLDIVAAGNIGLAQQGIRAAALVLSDADVRLLPDAAHPVENLDDAATRLAGLPSGNGPTNSSAPVHAGDTVPVRIIARDGVLGVDPEAASASGSDRFSLYLSKLARIRAGQISNLNLGLQHDNAGDISVIASKGDIIFPTQRATDANVNSNINQFRIDGPGRLDVIAAGDVRLAASEGIISRGSSVNVALPGSGATISVLAGVDPDLSYTAAIDKYLSGSTYAAQLAAYLKQLGVAVAGSALETFKSLSREQQRPLMLAVYYNELKQAGIDATKGKAGAFDRGYAATKTLFGADKSHGNLNMFLSRISTLAGGDINIVVPHGFVNAGVANASVVKDRSKLSRLGIVAEGAGSINAMVGDSFLVNQTRVFALDGGDVLVWSENKDIDAGGGAKTTLTVQRADTQYDFDAVPISLIPPAIAGSGIRTAVTTPGRAPGNVYLFAPSGIVNAGDAGIQSAGNITIAAVKVIGAENIIAGGTTVGVPVDTGGLGASLSSVSAASSSAGNAADTDVGGNKADEGAPLAQAALSWLEVFIMGLGEENCRQDDIECLKRQKKQQ